MNRTLNLKATSSEGSIGYIFEYTDQEKYYWSVNYDFLKEFHRIILDAIINKYTLKALIPIQWLLDTNYLDTFDTPSLIERDGTFCIDINLSSEILDHLFDQNDLISLSLSLGEISIVDESVVVAKLILFKEELKIQLVSTNTKLHEILESSIKNIQERILEHWINNPESLVENFSIQENITSFLDKLHFFRIEVFGDVPVTLLETNTKLHEKKVILKNICGFTGSYSSSERKYIEKYKTRLNSFCESQLEEYANVTALHMSENLIYDFLKLTLVLSNEIANIQSTEFFLKHLDSKNYILRKGAYSLIWTYAGEASKSMINSSEYKDIVKKIHDLTIQEFEQGNISFVNDTPFKLNSSQQNAEFLDGHALYYDALDVLDTIEFCFRISD